MQAKSGCIAQSIRNGNQKNENLDTPTLNSKLNS